MKRWIWLLSMSLVIGAGLAWIARPFEFQLRWGRHADQSATFSLAESQARAERDAPARSTDDRSAIDLAKQVSRAYATVAREVSPSVVAIYSERIVANNQQGGGNPFGGMFPDDFFHFFPQVPDRTPMRGMGSGVIIDPDGKVLTNNHVVRDADKVKVTLSDGRSFDAKVLGRDPKSDVAVLQIDARNLPAVKLGDSEAMEVGETVLAIGNPFELNQTVTAGIVSAKGRSSVGLADYEDFIQTDAAINPGNSGGALVNLDGELVGINTAIATRTGGYQGVGFAIPINMASKVMESLIRTGKVVRGYIGVTIQNVDQGIADNYGLDRPEGALVNSVEKGGPADRAGIEVGDLILELNGKTVRDRDDLRLRIGEMSPGQNVDLTVLRNGGRKSFSVKLGELPDEIAASGTPGDSGANPAQSLDKLGLDLQRIDRDTRQEYRLDANAEGLLVTGVEPGSPADDAGIKEGDVISQAGREAVSSVSDLKAQLAKVPAGKTILLKVHRENANIFLAMRIPKS